MDTIIMGLDLKQHNKILTKENKVFCAEETVYSCCHSYC